MSKLLAILDEMPDAARTVYLAADLETLLRWTREMHALRALDPGKYICPYCGGVGYHERQIGRLARPECASCSATGILTVCPSK